MVDITDGMLTSIIYVWLAILTPPPNNKSLFSCLSTLWYEQLRRWNSYLVDGRLTLSKVPRRWISWHVHCKLLLRLWNSSLVDETHILSIVLLLCRWNYFLVSGTLTSTMEHLTRLWNSYLVDLTLVSSTELFPLRSNPYIVDGAVPSSIQLLHRRKTITSSVELLHSRWSPYPVNGTLTWSTELFPRPLNFESHHDWTLTSSMDIFPYRWHLHRRWISYHVDETFSLSS